MNKKSVKDTLNDLISIERVIDDMYSESYISSSAKDYYITNYATEQEKEEMKKQEKIEFVFVCCFTALPFLLGFLFLLKESLIKTIMN